MERMADGHLNKCKECTKKDALHYRSENIEKVKEYDRSRGNLPHRVAARKEYAKTDACKESQRKSGKKYRECNTVKRAAHILVGNYVRDGKLIKSELCEDCGGKDSIHGHHDDYSRPLDVRWLCSSCHRKWHKENGEAKNG
jgi:hypothetical protein